jgi:hypothetical protein
VAAVLQAIIDAEYNAPDAHAIAGCWAATGWSAGLTLPAGHGWPDPKPDGGLDSDGLTGVLAARREPGGRLLVCSYLLHTYCLGVKNTIGPDLIPADDLDAYRLRFFDAFPGGHLEVPLELARELVYGAAAYARCLGFPPVPGSGYAKTRDHLGTWSGPSRIGFGKHGKPLYINGPRDNPDTVLRTLERTVGPGNYDYIIAMR